MNDNKEIKESLVRCHTCNKEIPLSAALTAEGRDYVYYFCNDSCSIEGLGKGEKNNPVK